MTDADRRGRLTPVDVVFVAVSLAVLAWLMQPYYQILRANAIELDTPEGYLFQLIPPVLVLTLMYVFYSISLEGAGT